MDAFRASARAAGAAPIGRIREDFAQEGGPTVFADDQQVTVAGVVTSSKTKTTKKNTLMAYVMLEDDTGSMELLCFAKCLENYGSYLREGSVITARGRLSVRDEKAPQLMCDFAHPLGENAVQPAAAQPEKAKTLYLRLPSLQSPEMEHFRRVIYMFEGQSNPVKIRLSDTGKLIGTTCDLKDSLVRELRERFGAENVVVK